MFKGAYKIAIFTSMLIVGGILANRIIKYSKPDTNCNFRIGVAVNWD